MNEWELTDNEIENTFKGKVIFASSPEMWRLAEANLIAQAAQKKLAEWLDDNGLLAHTAIWNGAKFICESDCGACQILKGAGILD